MVDAVPMSEAEIHRIIEKTRWSNNRYRVNSLSALAHGAPTLELRDLAARYEQVARDEERAIEEFPWPCERREAHGGHVVPVCTCASTETSFFACAVHGPGGHPDEETRWCRGVKAHPLTMIGKAHRG